MTDDARARWNARYGALGPGETEPSAALVELAALLPPPGPALVLACGRGANARWLAGRGFAVTGVDISDVAIEAAASLPERPGDEPMRWVRCDLELDPLPHGPFGLATCVNYLQRDVWRRVRPALAPGGVGIWVHPTRENLSRHAKPSSRFLLAPREAAGLMEDAGLDVLHSSEGWVGVGDDARHLAQVVARRSPTST